MNKKQRTNKHPKSSEARRRALAKIHIAKKQLGLDNETYRDILRNLTGFESAADLDFEDRSLVLDHLRMLGFRSTHKSAKASGMDKAPAKNRAPMLAKVGAILTELKLSWGYADAMARRMFGVYRVRWLEPEQLHKLVAALVYHQKNERKRREEQNNEA